MQIERRAICLREPELATEVFGPSTLVIRYDSRAGAAWSWRGRSKAN